MSGISAGAGAGTDKPSAAGLKPGMTRPGTDKPPLVAPLRASLPVAAASLEGTERPPGDSHDGVSAAAASHAGAPPLAATDVASGSAASGSLSSALRASRSKPSSKSTAPPLPEALAASAGAPAASPGSAADSACKSRTPRATVAACRRAPVAASVSRGAAPLPSTSRTARRGVARDPTTRAAAASNATTTGMDGVWPPRYARSRAVSRAAAGEAVEAMVSAVGRGVGGEAGAAAAPDDGTVSVLRPSGGSPRRGERKVSPDGSSAVGSCHPPALAGVAACAPALAASARARAPTSGDASDTGRVGAKPAGAGEAGAPRSSARTCARGSVTTASVWLPATPPPGAGPHPLPGENTSARLAATALAFEAAAAVAARRRRRERSTSAAATPITTAAPPPAAPAMRPMLGPLASTAGGRSAGSTGSSSVDGRTKLLSEVAEAPGGSATATAVASNADAALALATASAPASAFPSPAKDVVVAVPPAMRAREDATLAAVATWLAVTLSGKAPSPKADANASTPAAASGARPGRPVAEGSGVDRAAVSLTLIPAAASSVARVRVSAPASGRTRATKLTRVATDAASCRRWRRAKKAESPLASTPSIGTLPATMAAHSTGAGSLGSFKLASAS